MTDPAYSGIKGLLGKYIYIYIYNCGEKQVVILCDVAKFQTTMWIFHGLIWARENLSSYLLNQN